MKKVVNLILVLFVLIACNPLRHYEKVATDTNVTVEKKKTIEGWVNLNFPVETRYITGETIVIKDSSYDKNKIDSMSAIIDSAFANSHTVNVDSLKQAWLKLCVPKTIVKTVTRVDTATKIDPVPLFDMTEKFNKEHASNVVFAAQILAKNEIIAAENKKKRNLWFVIIGEFVGLVALAYLLFKPKITIG